MSNTQVILASVCVAALAVLGYWLFEGRSEITPRGSEVQLVKFDWSTHRREAPGSDNWPLTWSDDGHLYTSWGDGGGFAGGNRKGRVSLGYGRVEGAHDNYEGFNRWGGIDSECRATFHGKSYGLISIKGILYSWVSPGSSARNFAEDRLYKSTDKGCSWRDTGVVFTKDVHSISAGNILNYGRDYSGARDHYVYHYFVDVKDDTGLNIQSPGHIYLARVHSDSMEEQSAYEWYISPDPLNPAWGSFDERLPAFMDESGVSWTASSVTYVPYLEGYVLTTEHTKSGSGNIQMHLGQNPWGPWTEILREYNWPAAGEVEPTSFYWHLSPKWFRNGGREFTMVFTGFGENDSWNTIDGHFEIEPGRIKESPTPTGPVDSIAAD